MRKSKIDKEAAALRDSGDYELYEQLCRMNGVDEKTQDQFWNSVIDTLDNSPALQAAAKLEKELEGFKGGNKEKAVSRHVAREVGNFCEQSPLFAAAVLEKGKTLSDCCKEIMKGVGTSIADIEVYRRAVKYYMPGAKVKFVMEIQTLAVATPPTAKNVGKPKTLDQPAAPVIQISLFGEGG